MKVLLISHPRNTSEKSDFPPIGSAYLGAVVRDAGHSVAILDGGSKGVGFIINYVKSFKPDFIGITCWTINRMAVWELCNRIKQILPEAFLSLGGPHPTYCPEDVFHRTHASAIVMGEGEKTIIALLKCIESGQNIEKVAGLALPGENNTVRRTERRNRITNLDSIPFPWYEGVNGFNFDNYQGLPQMPHPTAAIISSRGCVFDCTFCGSTEFWERKWIYRSAENVLRELEYLIGELGAKSIYFFDDNLPVRKERLKKICEGILDRGWNIQWACCSHVRMVNKELLEIMKKSGCVRIDFGVESGSDMVLNSIKKKQKRKDIIKTFTFAHEVGIQPRAYLMVGNKGEDESTIDETVDLISKIKPYSSIGANIMWLLPGTQDYNEALANGYINKDYWISNDEDTPYNLQEHSLDSLEKLRNRLMCGIAKNKGGYLPILSYWLKRLYYKYKLLGLFRHFIPDKLR